MDDDFTLTKPFTYIFLTFQLGLAWISLAQLGSAWLSLASFSPKLFVFKKLKDSQTATLSSPLSASTLASKTCS